MAKILLVVIVAFLAMYWEEITGEEYILAMVGNSTFIRAISGEKGWIKIDTQPQMHFESYNEVFFRFTKSVTSGIENKTFLVSTSDTFLNIYGQSEITYFSPLPISALGTKYIVATCNIPFNFRSVLVIATFNPRTDIHITFRLKGSVTYDEKRYGNGDVLIVNLAENQTFTLITEHSLTGTSVESLYPVAVFVGTLDSSSKPTAYDQLLPVKHYGQEYVIAVNYGVDMQIISEHNDTQITFNDGKIAYVGKENIYRNPVMSKENLYFNTTRPVMTILCYKGKDYVRGFLVVPPVFTGVKESCLSVGRYYAGDVLILTDNDTDVQANTSRSASVEDIQWTQISNSRFKVGTVLTSLTTNIIINSITDRFIVLVYHLDHMHNGGYLFPSETFMSSTSTDYQPTLNSATTEALLTSLTDTKTPHEKLSTYGTTLSWSQSETTSSESTPIISMDVPFMTALIIGVGLGSIIIVLLIAIIVLLTCRLHSKPRKSPEGTGPTRDRGAAKADNQAAASADSADMDIDPSYAAVLHTSSVQDELDPDPSYAAVRRTSSSVDAFANCDTSNLSARQITAANDAFVADDTPIVSKGQTTTVSYAESNVDYDNVKYGLTGPSSATNYSTVEIDHLNAQMMQANSSDDPVADFSHLYAVVNKDRNK